MSWILNIPLRIMNAHGALHKRNWNGFCYRSRGLGRSGHGGSRDGRRPLRGASIACLGWHRWFQRSEHDVVYLSIISHGCSHGFHWKIFRNKRRGCLESRALKIVLYCFLCLASRLRRVKICSLREHCLECCFKTIVVGRLDALDGFF